MSSAQQPLIIKDFDQGIGASPHKGFGLFRNADIESKPGSVMVAKQPGTLFHGIKTQTFTADAGTDICTTSTDVEATDINYGGAAVYFTTTDTLPAGLSINTVYFLIKTTDRTFQVATSYKNAVGSASGTEINITDAGTGVHTINQVPIGIIRHIVRDYRTFTNFFIDSNGRVWFTSGTVAYLLYNSALDTGAAALTQASGTGLSITPFSSTTATFLFAFRNNAIDVVDVFGNTDIEEPSWTNGWQTMNTTGGSSNSHEAIEAQDAAIYFCDDRFIGSIIEKVDQIFDPSNAATYTYNNQALDLPPREIAQCLEELGTNLLIGGNSFNKIYPWNRVAGSFNLPMDVSEFRIKKMKNIGGTVYILAGSWGNIYLTQGSYVRHFKKIPAYVTNEVGSLQANPITWGGIGSLNGTLIFGMGVLTAGNSGLYRLWPDGRLTIDNVPSIGAANVTAIFSNDDFYTMGYDGGADIFNSTKYGRVRYENLETVIQSPLYKVATEVQKGTYSHAEVVFSKQPAYGKIELSYREETDGSFTEIDTILLSNLENKIWMLPEIGLTDIENIQIQVRMSDYNIGSIEVELAEIRLIP